MDGWIIYTNGAHFGFIDGEAMKLCTKGFFKLKMAEFSCYNETFVFFVRYKRKFMLYSKSVNNNSLNTLLYHDVIFVLDQTVPNCIGNQKLCVA
jgi:hypothetical protein